MQHCQPLDADPSTDFDVDALFTALDEQRRSRGLTWRAAAEEINALFHQAPGALGISASTLTGMRTKSAIEGDGVLQILIWLDRTPESFVPNRIDTDGSPLPRVGPKRILRWDPAAIHAALEARRGERGLTWSEVANEIGLSPGSLTGLAKAQRVGFPHVMRIVRWLGRPAASFTRASMS